MTASSSSSQSAAPALEQALQQAVAFHQAGNLQNAEGLYRSILREHPDHADANHNMGILAIQVNQPVASLPYFKAALQANPESAQYWLSYINAMHQAGDPSAARQLLDLGRRNGLQGEEVDRLEQRLSQPGPAPAQQQTPPQNTAPPNPDAGKTPQPAKGSPSAKDFNKLMALCSRGAYAEAVTLAQSMTARHPAHGPSWKMLGTALYLQQRREESVEPLRQAARLLPGDAEAHFNLGCALLDSGRLEEAEAPLRKALGIKPKWAEAHNNLGVVLRELGRIKEAETHLRRALELKPGFAEAHVNLGIALQQQMQLGEAEGNMRRALRIKPNFAKAHNNLGLNLREQNRYAEAEGSLRRALDLEPNFAEAFTNLGLTLQEQGKLVEAEASLRRALALTPDLPVAHSNLLFGLNYDPDKSAEEIYAAYQAFNARLGLPHQAEWKPHANSRDANRRLRIGYVSPDFLKHPVRHLLEPLLSHHDKRAVEVFAYAELHYEDDMTAKYKSYVDHWIPTAGMSDAALAERVRADGIDVLVDLAGHTAKNRLGVFARKPAPVSVSWLGYGYTTGLTAIDYYLVDAAIAPEGSDHLFAEKPWRLPTPALAFRFAEGMGPVNALPAAERGYVTFASLSRAIRMNHRTIRVWAEILKRVKGAKLVINSKNFQTPDAQDIMAAKFAAHGIAREQLEIGFQTPPWDVMRGTDIALDCFPHNSGTTLVEHLYMGIPYVTLENRPSVGRIGSSMLRGVGHPEWIARSEEEYIAKAVELASDLPKLAAIRAALRGEMESGPAMDEARFTRQVEAAFQEMFKRWSAQNP